MKILFLTNNKISDSLIRWLRDKAGEEVIVIEEKISAQTIIKIMPDLVVSYNYRYILKEDVICLISGRIINLHISYLPWNRGAYPNVWAFLDDTQKGVTIHLIDKGLDTGRILLRKEVLFDKDAEQNETLASSYAKLHNEIQKLFIDNWGKIRNNRLNPSVQHGEGSYHNSTDFELIKHLLEPEGWGITIAELKERYIKWKSQSKTKK